MPVTNSQLAIAYLADLAFGDPEWLPHPVRLFGRIVNQAENAARRVADSPRTLRFAGIVITASISLGVGIGSWLLLKSAGKFSPAAASVAVVYLAYTTLSARGLDQAGRKVIEHLQAGDLEAARSALGMIVGRDTDKLDASEIVRAVIETVAENTSDGVVAPMLYLSLGGVPVALTYKAINTLDSMIGYKDERYLHYKDLLRLASVFTSHRKYFVIDESFIDFTHHASLVMLAARQRFLIVLRSFTKFFAIPGLRIGYLVGHRSVIRHLEAQLEPWSVNALALVAAAESVKDSPYREKTLALIAREKRYVSDALAKLEWLEAYPSESNFLLVRIKAQGFRGSDLCQRLEKENIVIRDASGFRGLGPQYVRIAIRSRRENRRLVDALHAIGLELSKNRGGT